MAVSSYGYPLDRTGRTRFDDRAGFLEKAAERRKGGRGSFTPEICQAIEAVIAAGDSRRGEPWSRFAWLTIIVGSGCLDEGVRVSADELGIKVGGAVRDALRGVIRSGASSPASDLIEPTALFAADLVRSRIGKESPAVRPVLPGAGNAELPADDETIEPLAVRLLVLACLLTRFFHQARAAGHAASGRWDDDEAILRPADEDTIGRDTVEPALVLLRHLEDELEQAAADADNVSEAVRVSQAVRALLDRVSTQLSPAGAAARPAVNVDHLRLITEVAWYYLGRRNSLYPGWTEMLLRLMLREGKPVTTTSGRARPRNTHVAELPGAIEELLMAATVSSWHASRDVKTRRDQLYAAVADVLCAQAEALDGQAEKLRRDGRAASLPPAAAFVTSFDLELDMALWRAPSARPFQVALPVHVLRDQRTREAEFCWLLGTVIPATGASADDGLKRLRTPTAWRLLTPQTATDVLRSRASVIHLSGCPLFALPVLSEAAHDKLVEDLGDVGVTIDRDEAQLSHAITVDEYLALRQSEAELFWTSNSDGTGADRSRALHPSFTKDGDDNPRYWMALGVPMGDPAVRNRVASQITLRWIRDSAHRSRTSVASERHLGPDPALLALTVGDRDQVASAPAASYRADVDGVAINKRLSDDEVGLLNWLGLDVVEASCEEFTKDLEHYSRHVRTEPHRPRFDQRCPLRASPPAA